ncbi:MAG: M23 family metallopeptidase [Armatimonadetes bacterium]|nr:M23 family metallopeptidase [Armatimonadota bacterium]
MGVVRRRRAADRSTLPVGIAWRNPARGLRWLAALVACLCFGSPAAAAAGRVALALEGPEITQGETVAVTVSGPGIASARLVAGGREIPLYRVSGRLVGLLGTDPLTRPGSVHLVLTAVDEAGRRLTAAARLRVRDGRFGARNVTLSPDTMRLLSPQKVAEERRRFAEAVRRTSARRLWQGPFLHPVAGALSSGYGVRSIYSGRPGGYHLGVDYAADDGTPVRAANRGRVTLADRLPLSGNIVVIDHGMGVFTSYHHMSSLAVREGQEVARGDLLGHVGSTGLSTGPHLHWAMLVGQARVNPLHWTRRPPLP